MNFSVILFSMIATALAASIPLETSTAAREPSLTDSVPVASGDKQSRELNALVGLFESLNTLNNEYLSAKLEMIAAYVRCVIDSSTCSEETSAMVHQQTKEKFVFPPASAIALNAVNPNNPKHPFPVTVPAFWNPNVNVPLVAFHNEMPNVAYSSAPSFIPYLNSLAAYSDPSFTTILAQHAKGLVPAGTFLKTTP
ncbi:uncharacterized protein LOC132088354 [Daphnia carinata]|uniref:uncharacterized protein LOC132088354 n=1 Tax=Daphnia carinata TaxID=120202 RepID=UPI002868883B|nr:uncharacterized protein LOC132088354 [Daphnia carinata]